jgi:UDP-glucose 4-epimerase
LPIALCHNRRSLLARENLIAAIHHVLRIPPAGETYIVADSEALTLAEIVAALRAGAGRRPGLLPVPRLLLGAILRAAGHGEEWERLGREQVADPSKLLAAGWRPPVDTRAGLAAVAQAAAQEAVSAGAQSPP